ncbi:hypothetical protein [Luteibacter sp. SG786]|uniref:hypothetical protein n=1 Tax=Luteibacter sp. SG786 TaxID=2587130 RepID=UPI00141FFB13|nr:hypothetical protein [Luteibacter sp. SG786]NII54415.1 hypothetical protein [Luteibacter sp. SG786]
MMLAGVIAKRRNVVPAGNLAIMPFTYDETDKNSFLSFTRQGNGPHQTPSGMECDGYEARYKATTIPSWMSPKAHAFGFQMTYTGYCHARVDAKFTCPLSTKDALDIIAYMGSDATSPSPKALFGNVADPANAGNTVVAFRTVGASSTRTVHMGRTNWRFRHQTPEYQSGGNTWVPQAILFKDANHLWLSAHLNDTKSRTWEVNPSDGSLLRFYDFPSPYNHVANFARRPSTGDVWFTDSPTSNCGIVDMEASFTAGTAVVTTVMDTTSFNKIGAIDFITVSGTEYFVAAEYKTSGTPYLYVFPASVIGAVTLTASNRFKRWPIGIQIQGLCVSGTKLYISANNSKVATPSAGFIERYDLANLITSVADGATITPEYVELAASGFPEDACVHPSTGDIWTPTEGNSSPISDRAYLSVWSSPVNGTGQENTYTANYDGAGNFTILMNGLPYFTLSDTPATDVSTVCVGGPPQASVGFTNGYAFGFVKNVAIKDAPIDATSYAAIVSGSYESGSLSTYTLTLTNPGAESGNTTGWTSESGNLNVFPSTTLPPHNGSWSFYTGNQALSITRQRVTVPSGAQSAIDAGNAWVKARWWQASNDATSDPGGAGIRTLDATPTQLTEAYSGQQATPLSVTGSGPYPWWPRAFEAAAPSGTRNVDMLLKSTRTSGTNNDTYADDFSMVIYAK